MYKPFIMLNLLIMACKMAIKHDNATLLAFDIRPFYLLFHNDCLGSYELKVKLKLDSEITRWMYPEKYNTILVCSKSI